MRFTFCCTKQFYDKLKASATDAGMGLNEYIRYAVTTFWNMK